MRTLELLRAFNERELKKLEGEIKGQKRKSLQLLYAELKKYVRTGGEPTNETLFQKIFNQEYSSTKNYLLRNELRLLNDIIYEILLVQTFLAYTKEHRSSYYLWLARSFFRRNLNTIFDADIDRFIEYAKKYVKPEDTSLMLDLKGLWMIYTQPKTIDNLNQQLATASEWKDEQIRHLKYRLRELESREAYLQFTINAITGVDEIKDNDVRTLPQQQVHLNPTGEEDAYENYLIQKKYSYQTRGQKRIEVLQQMIAYANTEALNSESAKQNPVPGWLNSIATEYVLMGEYSKASNIMLESIACAEKLQQPVIISTLQNYVANQINLAAYQQGIDFYNRYEKQIVHSRQYVPTAISKAYCHLFLNQDDEALNCLPVQVKLTEQQNLMMRMVYLIAFIMRKQHDLAVNECNNIGRMIKANEGAYYTTYNWINKLFTRYLNLQMLPRTQRNAEIDKLKNEITANNDSAFLMTTEFSLRWLNNQLGRY